MIESNSTSKDSNPGDSLDGIVRQFIVQEKYQCEEYSQYWFDDPDQPEETEKTPEAAAGWISKDFRENPGHAGTYHHRIIERTERVYHHETAIERMLILSNALDDR
jgi:hypothetical protein